MRLAWNEIDSNALQGLLRLCLATIVLLLLGTLKSSFAQSGSPCALVGDATRIASSIRGLRVRREVPCKLQDRAQVEKFLLDTIEEKIPAERFRLEGELYKILGIIPKDFEYLDGIVSLYTSQLGGYYDPDKEFYAMASWMPPQLQLPIAVHELTHALQDQYYELDNMMDHAKADSDVLAARSALVEGDATAVMIDFSRQLAGQGPVQEEASVASMMMQNIAGAMLSSSMSDAPPALQAMLIFPYVSGLRFAHALLREGGYKALDAAFRNLPQSTEHILHPELYLRGERGFEDVIVPPVPQGVQVASTKAVHQDRLGEFFVSTFLGMHIPPVQASKAASGWGGDRVALYPLQDSSRFLLVWVLHWDTERDAQEFFDALKAYYAKRLAAPEANGGSTVSFLDPDFGPVEIMLADRRVRLTVGR